MTATLPDSARNSTEDLISLDVRQIAPSQLNPRKHFPEEALEELAQSIKEHGLIEPIVVRPAGGSLYSLVAGERRWRAAVKAGVDMLPARVLHVDDTTALQLMLIENLARQDLDPIEEASGYAQLHKLCGMTQAQIAASVNRSQPAIANAMRLLELPEEIRTWLQEGKMTAAHARALVRYKDYPIVCRKIAELVIEKGMTSRQLERGFAYEGIPRYELRGSNYTTLVSSLEGLTAAEAKAHGLTVWGEGSWAVTPDVEKLPDARKAVSEARSAEIQKKLEQARKAAQPVAPDPAVDTDGKPPKGKRGRNGVPVSDLPKLDDLPYGSYEVVATEYGRPWPTACGPACACRAKAIDHKGKVVDISTKPRHVSSLRAQETKRENEEKSSLAAKRADELREALAAAPAIDARGLAIAVQQVCTSGSYDGIKHEAEKEVLTRHGGECRSLSSSRYDTRVLDQLVKLGPEALARILVEVILLSDMQRAIEEHTSPSQRVAWYLEHAKKPAAEPEEQPKSVAAKEALAPKPSENAQAQEERRRMEEVGHCIRMNRDRGNADFSGISHRGQQCYLEHTAEVEALIDFCRDMSHSGYMDGQMRDAVIQQAQGGTYVYRKDLDAAGAAEAAS